MIRHIARISAGVVLLVIGIAGIFLPFIPGLLLIFLGLAALLDRNPKVWFEEIKAKIKSKYQKSYAAGYARENEPKK